MSTSPMSKKAKMASSANSSAPPSRATWSPPHSLLDRQLPVWLVRVLIGAASAALGAFGWATVNIVEGQLSWGGSFVPKITLAVIAGLAIGIIAALIPRFGRLPLLKFGTAFALIVYAVAAAADSIRTALLSGLLCVVLLLGFPHLASAVRRRVRPLLRLIFRLGMSKAATLLLFGSVTLLLSVGVTAPALAQGQTEEVPLAGCEDFGVFLTLPGIELTDTEGVPDAIGQTVDLVPGRPVVFAASTTRAATVTMSLVLAKTEPFDVVQGRPHLLWHGVFDGNGELSATIDITDDGPLGTFDAEIEGTNVSVPVFSGVGSLQATLIDIETGETCSALLFVRITTSNWDSLLGLAATAALVVGAAACASMVLARPSYELEANQCTVALGSDPAIYFNADEAIPIRPRVHEPLVFELSLVDIDEDEELVKKLKREGWPRVSVRDAAGLIDCSVSLQVGIAGSLEAIVDAFTLETTGEGELQLKIAGQKLIFPYDIDSPEVPPSDRLKPSSMPVMEVAT